ncbi:unnamed protein product [Parnassius apollo]|uniref:(apollo) hypothetical protein n=1 Tax=Parnassius apollo TaxID=110799 RepID=A0A8S3XRN9_PARAO|nr:unnamed protein product [Parnassius apollo]
MKVNLHGHLTLGKEVMDFLSYFLDSNPASGRRDMSSQENDVIVKMVKSKQLCRDLQFCTGLLSQLIDDYIIIQIISIKSIFKESSYEFFSKTEFYDKINKILRDLRKILKIVNGKINDEKESYYWISIIKKISAKFQKLVIYNIADNPNSFDLEKKDERKILIQKSIIAIVSIESNYEMKLCAQYSICIKSFECTRALHAILKKLTNIPEDKVRSFIRYFYEALFASTFYSRLSDITAREFQIILNDMAYSKNVPTTSLLQSVLKTIELRLEQIGNYNDTQMEYDVQLIHVILSDLDHFYSTHTSQPFRDFIKNFIDWTMYGRLGKYLRKIMYELGSEVSSQSEEMSLKIMNEVKVFLELTIDPEK